MSSNDFTAKHRRGPPSGLEFTPKEERELMDLRTGLDRVRRKVASEAGAEPWGISVPRSMALLFDRLPSPFTQQEAVAEALRQMRAHELGSDAPEGYVKHPVAKNWF